MQLSAPANTGAVEVLFAVPKVDVGFNVVKIVDDIVKIVDDIVKIVDDVLKVEFNVVKVLDDIVRVLSEAVSTGTNSEQHTSSTSPSV